MDAVDQKVAEEVGEETPISTDQNRIGTFRTRNSKLFKALTFVSLWVGFISYVVAACLINFDRARVLFHLTVIINALLAYYLLKKLFGPTISKNMWTPFIENTLPRYRKILNWIGGLAFALFVSMWLICDTSKEPSRFISLLGLFVFVLIGYVSSTHRKQVIWRPVLWGFALQFIFGLVILRTNTGYEVFRWIGDVMAKLLGFSSAGYCNYNILQSYFTISRNKLTV